MAQFAAFFLFIAILILMQVSCIYEHDLTFRGPLAGPQSGTETQVQCLGILKGGLNSELSNTSCQAINLCNPNDGIEFRVEDLAQTFNCAVKNTSFSHVLNSAGPLVFEVKGNDGKWKTCTLEWDTNSSYLSGYKLQIYGYLENKVATTEYYPTLTLVSSVKKCGVEGFTSTSPQSLNDTFTQLIVSIHSGANSLIVGASILLSFFLFSFLLLL
jgi:hypothetical protein